MQFNDILASTVHQAKNEIHELLNVLDRVEQQTESGIQTSLGDVKIAKQQALLVNDELIRLLAVYQINEVKKMVAVQEVDGLGFLHDQIQRHQISAQIHNLELTLAPDIGEFEAYFNPLLVQAALAVAINNAVRYANDKIILNVNFTEQGLQFQVHDDGQGWGSDELVVRRKNTGLGLQFAQLIAGQHKNGNQVGELKQRQSKLLGGAEFVLCLP